MNEQINRIPENVSFQREYCASRMQLDILKINHANHWPIFISRIVVSNTIFLFHPAFGLFLSICWFVIVRMLRLTCTMHTTTIITESKYILKQGSPNGISIDETFLQKKRKNILPANVLQIADLFPDRGKRKYTIFSLTKSETICCLPNVWVNCDRYKMPDLMNLNKCTNYKNEGVEERNEQFYGILCDHRVLRYSSKHLVFVVQHYNYSISSNTFDLLYHRRFPFRSLLHFMY